MAVICSSVARFDLVCLASDFCIGTLVGRIGTSIGSREKSLLRLSSSHLTVAILLRPRLRLTEVSSADSFVSSSVLRPSEMVTSLSGVSVSSISVRETLRGLPLSLVIDMADVVDGVADAAGVFISCFSDTISVVFISIKC